MNQRCLQFIFLQFNSIHLTDFINQFNSFSVGIVQLLQFNSIQFNSIQLHFQFNSNSIHLVFDRSSRHYISEHNRIQSGLIKIMICPHICMIFFNTFYQFKMNPSNVSLFQRSRLFRETICLNKWSNHYSNIVP